MRIFKQKRKTDGATAEGKTWIVEFRDHAGIVRRLGAYRDKTLSQDLGRKLSLLAECVKAGDRPAGDLRTWIESIPAKMRERLAQWGLLSAAVVAAGKGLEEHLDGWRNHLEAKQATPRYIRRSLIEARYVWQECGFDKIYRRDPRKDRIMGCFLSAGRHRDCNPESLLARRQEFFKLGDWCGFAFGKSS